VTREIWLAADIAAPRHARAFVPGVLADWGLSRLREDAELVASELVTNALRVARGTIRVRLVLLDCSMILEVWDPSVALPSIPLAAALDSECGRGMLIVETLSAEWSTYCAAEGGKWVWAELR
jgi:anti-sigma regulatory factor (Ser/Thr protein kinase)